MTKRFLTVAVAGLFTLSACGKDSTAPNANLSQAQVEDMMDAMSAIQDFSFVGAGMASAASRGQASLVTAQIDESAQCPVSGTVHVVGTESVDNVQNPTQFSADITETHQACKAQSSSGKTWQFDGRPNIHSTVTYHVTNLDTGSGTITGSQQGTIGFASEGVSGQCSVSLTINLSFNGTTGAATGSLSGTVCGRDVSQDLSSPGI